MTVDYVTRESCGLAPGRRTLRERRRDEMIMPREGVSPLSFRLDL